MSSSSKHWILSLLSLSSAELAELAVGRHAVRPAGPAHGLDSGVLMQPQRNPMQPKRQKCKLNIVSSGSEQGSSSEGIR